MHNFPSVMASWSKLAIFAVYGVPEARVPLMMFLRPFFAAGALAEVLREVPSCP